MKELSMSQIETISGALSLNESQNFSDARHHPYPLRVYIKHRGLIAGLGGSLLGAPFGIAAAGVGAIVGVGVGITYGSLEWWAWQ